MMRHLAAALLAGLLAACGQTAAGPDLNTILAEKPARTLSEYGLFADASAREPAEGVVSYNLVNPLFSDHAAKHRFVYVPKNKAAAYRPDEVFDFPVGTVLVKTFAFAPDMRQPTVDEHYRETRLLIRKAEGWAAYPYVWNEKETEAVYAPAGAWLDLAFTDEHGTALDIDYRVPNQNQCKTGPRAVSCPAFPRRRPRCPRYPTRPRRWSNAPAPISISIARTVTGWRARPPIPAFSWVMRSIPRRPSASASIPRPPGVAQAMRSL